MLYEMVQSCLAASLRPREAYQPFPTCGERSAWDAMPRESKAYFQGAVRGMKQSELLKPLRAVRYMDFTRNGNRVRYEDVQFERRANLLTLVFAECIANDGALLDDIIDLIWAICEESSWVIPAHNGSTGALPDVEAPVNIDLFSAETGSTLAWTYYLLRGKLNEQSPLIARRVEVEITKRILTPYLEDDTFWWKGFESGHVNNWNPWINGNVLSAFLLIEADAARREAGIALTAKSVQKFIDAYFPDGGCDEGPSYFTVAGGALFDYLETLHGATGGAVDIYGEPLIQNMAKYIYRVHVSGSYYVNFADAPARVHVPAGLLRRVGTKIGDDMLCRFARYISANGYTSAPYQIVHTCVFRRISDLFDFAPEQGTEAPYAAPAAHMFDGIQVMTARQKENSGEGFFLAAKGGHNHESHNHNDIGNFVLYRNGQPVIIDAGVETYTKKTFGDRRYEIWTMQSDYHNVPQINGVSQMDGQEFAARDVRYDTDGVLSQLMLDIAGAYPAAAQVKQYERRIALDRAADTVTVTDQFALDAAVAPLVLHLMCADEPTGGEGVFRVNGTVMRYDAAQFDAAVEAVPLDDPRLSASWERKALYRIRLAAKQIMASGEVQLVFGAE